MERTESQACYLPEGSLLDTPENAAGLSSEAALRTAMQTGQRLEARVRICDGGHNLHVELPCMRGLIPRAEGALRIPEGTTRDIALISRVNKPVCFSVMRIEQGADGLPVAVLSRRAQQEHCRDSYISRLRPGDVIPARVTHLAPFGCFVDIGCGVPSLIPIDAISVSRISHPADRFRVGQMIRAAVKGFENGRVLLTHKELLGTWEENAALFSAGQTVSGIIRSVETYGVFVELAPNLAGLAESTDGAIPGHTCSVYIKSILPERMKVKLVLIDVGEEAGAAPFRYFIDPDEVPRLTRWRYSPEGCRKVVESVFEEGTDGNEQRKVNSE
jgi:small subunit ribosomal protein S1